MIRDWLPWRRAREDREASGYTSAIISAIEAAAAGGSSVGEATAAVESDRDCGRAPWPWRT